MYEYVYVCISLSLSSSVSSSACLSFRSAIPFARDPTPDEGGHPYVTVGMAIVTPGFFNEKQVER